MKYKIGVYGSAVKESTYVMTQAKILGIELGKNQVIIITGACIGIPLLVALTAYNQYQTEIWGFSPGKNLSEQKSFSQPQHNQIYKRLIYIPQKYQFTGQPLITRKYRNVTSTATCDAGIIISGRWGTMNEFTNLYDMGKVIGVLTGTGGIADELPNLTKKITKKSQAIVIFESHPEKLIKLIVDELNKRKKYDL